MNAKLFVLTASLALVFVAVPATANNGAVVGHKTDEGCDLLTSTGGLAAGTFWHTVSNHAGNAKLTCKSSQEPVAESVTWNFENTGYSCNTPWGSTTIWHNTIDVDGGITLQCFIKKA